MQFRAVCMGIVHTEFNDIDLIYVSITIYDTHWFWSCGSSGVPARKSEVGTGGGF